MNREERRARKFGKKRKKEQFASIPISTIPKFVRRQLAPTDNFYLKTQTKV